jgi:hypothetical protein
MATERQIAANRRNAQKSTGPRSVSGKKRASKNAFRHGLCTPMAGPAFARAVEHLACRLVRDGADASALGSAREAAEGMLDLERVRRFEVALIARVSAFGRLDVPKIFASIRDEVAWVALHFLGAKLRKNEPKFAVDDLPEMPTEEPQRTAEAVRRALPALLRLQRYEARAAARRDRAVRELALSQCLVNDTT